MTLLRSLFLVALVVALTGATARATALDAAAVTEKKIDQVAASAATPRYGRDAALVRSLRSLGPAALKPMLARLSKPSAAMETLKPAESARFRAALAEAIGTLESPEAVPALTSALSGTNDDRTTQSLLTALARLCRTAGTFDTIAPHAAAGHAHEKAGIAALGSCRVPSANDLLVGRLTSKTPELQLAAVDALGLLGSSWAWEALGPTAAKEGLSIRTRARDALLALYRTSDKAAQVHIARAIVTLDVPGTDALLTDPADKALAAKWARMHARR